VNELRGEKVDVVQWRDDVAQFIAEALGPAKVKEVRIDEEEKAAEVIVSEHQLSLAIGKEGQNARLAARLSGYKVDIRSDVEPVVEDEGAVAEGETPVEDTAVPTEETPPDVGDDEDAVDAPADAGVPVTDEDAAEDAVTDESE
jgi:N utilization substance protein A